MNKSAEQLVDELLQTLTLTQVDDGVFVGRSDDYVGVRIFGGQVLAQALMAGANTLATAKPCHSLHGYFLRAGNIDYPVHYEVLCLRDGRSLSARQITAVQYIQGVRQVIFVMLASFAPMDKLGLDYQKTMPNYPSPDGLSDEQTLKQHYVDSLPTNLQARFLRQRPILIKPVAPCNPFDRVPCTPHQAVWLTIPKLDEQTAIIHQALLVFASDFHLAGTGLMGHGLTYLTQGLQVASIDHSIHFHRPFDMGQWLLYDMWSDSTSFDKGLNHGQFWQAGNLIATTQQEGLMRLRSKP